MVKVTFRWWPVVPIGIPHRAEDDIEYGGYLIPKGAILMSSLWWFLHDPKTYKNPDSFDPTRYFSPREEPDPSAIAFGLGRRICPGRHVAESSLFLTVAQLLATFNISKDIDAEGNEIEPVVGGTPGTVSRPKAFAYRLAPRSATHQELIRNIETEYPWEPSGAEHLGNKDFIQQIGVL